MLGELGFISHIYTYKDNLLIRCHVINKERYRYISSEIFNCREYKIDIPCIYLDDKIKKISVFKKSN